MNQTELEAIVTAVTGRVMEALQSRGQNTPKTDGLPRILVVGKELPTELQEDAVLCSLEEYDSHRNILHYDKLIITELNPAQLADIAQGRTDDLVTTAVVYALLNGVDVFITEGALIHRKFVGKGSVALYQLLEGYVKTLQVYGVKLLRSKVVQKLVELKPAKFQAPIPPVPLGSSKTNASMLITEADALQMIKSGSEVRLQPGAIVTPSAQDVFAQARVSLTRSCCAAKEDEP